MSLATRKMTSPRSEKAPYRPYGGALQAWRSGAREVLLCGPADTGKSRLWLEKLHYCADKYPHMRGLIVRKTRKSLSQSAMVTYEQKVLPLGWMDRLIHFNTTDQQYEYPNGSIVAIAGMDDADKVQSSEWDFIYPQEATELSENDWEILTKCLRNDVMPYQQIGGDANPSYPTHWLKKRCDAGKTLMLYSHHEDNPTITPERIAVLQALSGIRYLRLYKGLWVAAEGMVYDEWESARHKVSTPQLIEWEVFYANGTLNRQVIRQLVAGVDWGYSNPGVIVVFGVDSDGRMYLLREVYHTRQTDDWWLDQALLLSQEMGGIDVFACDPSMPAYIRKFTQAGLPAIGADNDITVGVRTLQSRMKVAGDGRPRFYVHDSALRERDELRAAEYLPLCFEDEILEYVWPKAKEGQPLQEKPVDCHNHSLDAARYAAMQLGPEHDLMELDSDTREAILSYRGY
jgi:PBSX family phage terminase large subunit